jgi:hypothetical protein
MLAARRAQDGERQLTDKARYRGGRTIDFKLAAIAR